MIHAASDAFYVNYSTIIPESDLVAHPLSIIHPEADVDLARAQTEGNTILAYLSVGEVAVDASYRERLMEEGIVFKGKNTVWNSDLIDVRTPEWSAFLLDQLVPGIMEKGFDGLFLDTLDAVELLIQEDPDNAQAYRTGMIALIKGLKQRFPDSKIVMNRGFNIWKDVIQSVDGILIESVFRTYDFSTETYQPVSEPDTKWLQDRIREIQAAGSEVYILDYIHPSDSRAAKETATKIHNLGCHGFLSTPELDGKNLGPLRPVKRNIQVFYGNVASRPAEKIHWPVDTLTASNLQMPLEWMGYELEYRNMADHPLPSQEDLPFAGVILDPSLHLEPASESELVDWLIEQVSEGLKIFMVYDFPIRSKPNIERLMEALGIETTLQDYLIKVTELESTVSSPSMGYEEGLLLHDTRFKPVRAPSSATRLFSVTAKTPEGVLETFDAVFAAPWGGVALQPYLFFERPDSLRLWLVDPFDLLSSVFGKIEGPKPDITSKDGNRILFSHIEGEGFTRASTVSQDQYAAEVIMKRIIDRYPIPFTCSVIEAEIKGQLKGQHVEAPGRPVILARELFQRPNVEAASNSYSHPYYWIDQDRYHRNFPARTFPLTTENPSFDPRREIEGSIDFINKTLLTGDKKVQLFLWTGNNRPSLEALEILEQLGIPNMNGGQTALSPRYPSLSKVSPATMPWGPHLQVYSPIESEQAYLSTINLEGNNNVLFEGGFFHVIDTFKQTGTPRRLKPINLHFHWYSGTRLMGLAALKRVFDWAMQQEFQSMSASTYSKWVVDSRNTSVYEYLHESSWVMVNRGHCQTFRLDDQNQIPDMQESKGLSGFREFQGSLYLHGTGQNRTKVTLRNTDSPTTFGLPHLVRSTSPMDIRTWQSDQIAFSVSDRREGLIELAGFPIHFNPDIQINQAAPAKGQVHVEKGRLRLKTPQNASVDIRWTSN